MHKHIAKETQTDFTTVRNVGCPSNCTNLKKIIVVILGMTGWLRYYYVQHTYTRDSRLLRKKVCCMYLCVALQFISLEHSSEHFRMISVCYILAMYYWCRKLYPPIIPPKQISTCTRRYPAYRSPIHSCTHALKHATIGGPSYDWECDNEEKIIDLPSSCIHCGSPTRTIFDDFRSDKANFVI